MKKLLSKIIVSTVMLGLSTSTLPPSTATVYAEDSLYKKWDIITTHKQVNRYMVSDK